MKYHYNEDKITDRKELCLWLIANELAEANRLKRIEIEWQLPDMKGEILQSVKEDQG